MPGHHGNHSKGASNPYPEQEWYLLEGLVYEPDLAPWQHSSPSAAAGMLKVICGGISKHASGPLEQGWCSVEGWGIRHKKMFSVM